MTNQEILDRIQQIETAIELSPDFTLNAILVMAGEWQGLRKSLGVHNEGAWAMVHRLRGI